MNLDAVPWQDVSTRLRAFVAARVPGPDVDDVLQDVFVRMQRGLANLRDDQRLSGWLLQVARSAIADHGRARARHPLVDTDDADEPAAEPPDDDRRAFELLVGCVAAFVARLPSPYREAVILVELEEQPLRVAAAVAGVSLSGMKSRVQRGRAKLRALLEDCCEIGLDVRGKVTDCTPHCARTC